MTTRVKVERRGETVRESRLPGDPPSEDELLVLSDGTDCMLRGAFIDIAACSSCNGGKEYKVYECSKFGRCTKGEKKPTSNGTSKLVGKVKDIACCLVCRERVKPE